MFSFLALFLAFLGLIAGATLLTFLLIALPVLIPILILLIPILIILWRREEKDND